MTVHHALESTGHLGLSDSVGIKPTTGLVCHGFVNPAEPRFVTLSRNRAIPTAAGAAFASLATAPIAGAAVSTAALALALLATAALALAPIAGTTIAIASRATAALAPAPIAITAAASL